MDFMLCMKIPRYSLLVGDKKYIGLSDNFGCLFVPSKCITSRTSYHITRMFIKNCLHKASVGPLKCLKVWRSVWIYVIRVPSGMHRFYCVWISPSCCTFQFCVFLFSQQLYWFSFQIIFHCKDWQLHWLLWSCLTWIWFNIKHSIGVSSLNCENITCFAWCHRFL